MFYQNTKRKKYSLIIVIKNKVLQWNKCHIINLRSSSFYIVLKKV